jgi:hypothetical protein
MYTKTGLSYNILDSLTGEIGFLIQYVQRLAPDHRRRFILRFPGTGSLSYRQYTTFLATYITGAEVECISAHNRTLVSRPNAPFCAQLGFEVIHSVIGDPLPPTAGYIRRYTLGYVTLCQCLARTLEEDAISSWIEVALTGNNPCERAALLVSISQSQHINPEAIYKSVQALMGNIIIPFVRDLEWQDLDWQGNLFGEERTWCIKPKHDGTRCVLLYVAGSAHIWIRELGEPMARALLVRQPHEVSFVVDGELLEADNKFFPFDVPYFNGWLTAVPLLQRIKNFAAIEDVIPFSCSAPAWRALEHLTGATEETAQAFLLSLAAALDTEMLSGSDGWILSENKSPWQPYPQLKRFINAFKIKPVAKCTVDLAFFDGRLFAEGPRGTCNYQRDLSSSHPQPGMSWIMQHPDYQAPSGAKDGEVWEFDASKQCVGLRASKFMHPNNIVQVSAVRLQGILPITAENIRIHSVRMLLILQLARLVENQPAQIFGFSGWEHDVLQERIAKPVAGGLLEGISVVHHTWLRKKEFPLGQVVALVPDVTELPHGSWVRRCNNNLMVSNFNEICRWSLVAFPPNEDVFYTTKIN